MANQKILNQKQEVINEIADKVKNSATIVFAEYHGLSVGDMTELRRTLRANEGDIKIYKNTLTKRALDSLKLDLTEELNGPKATIFGNDLILPIKALSKFANAHKALVIKAGIVEGKVVDIAMINELANTPSRDELLTMVAAGLMEHVKNVAICLDLHIKNLES